MAAVADRGTFYGWRVVGAAFVLAVFGWGIGFFGPPVFLSTLQATRGWPLSVVSTAVTIHFLVGALVGARLPALYRRFGPPAVTKAGSLALVVGIFGWSVVTEPWQLMAVTLLSGAGWGTMSASAVNALVSPWFVRARPAALGMAYNGGSVGGIIFSPLWVAAIAVLGFPLAAAGVALVVAVTMWVLADRVFSRTPEAMGVAPDGGEPGSPQAAITSPHREAIARPLLWRDRRFLTLAAGMALGLFAQIGLVAHLFSLMVPALGAQQAGLAMGLVTVMAVSSRVLIGWFMPVTADRRIVACVCYALQAMGSIAFMLAQGESVAAAAARRAPVRLGLRLGHLHAAARRPGRVRQGGGGARGRPHRRHLAGAPTPSPPPCSASSASTPRSRRRGTRRRALPVRRRRAGADAGDRRLPRGPRPRLMGANRRAFRAGRKML